MTNKNTTIKNATDDELKELIIRIQRERELQELLSSIVRNSSTKEEKEKVDYNFPISASQPIDNLYHKQLDSIIQHIGILGMKWGKRKDKRITKNKRAYKTISDFISRKKSEKEEHIKKSKDKISIDQFNAIRTRFGKRASDKILVNMSKKGTKFESEVIKAKFIKAGKKILIANKIGKMFI